MKKCRKCGESYSNHYFIQKMQTFVKGFCIENEERFEASVRFGRKDSDQASSRQATPGSSLPSMNSREAPPPVEIWVILSA